MKDLSLSRAMKYWSRDDTKDWIMQIELRLEDIHFYLTQTAAYCDHYQILDNSEVLTLSIMTCIWVASMRAEQITLSEVIDILNLDMEIQSDKTYDMGKDMKDLDFEEMLDLVRKNGPFLSSY